MSYPVHAARSSALTASLPSGLAVVGPELVPVPVPAPVPVPVLGSVPFAVMLAEDDVEAAVASSSLGILRRTMGGVVLFCQTFPKAAFEAPAQ